MKLNIEPHRIVVVYPNEDSKKKFSRFNCFNNPYVNNVMNGVLAALGIKVYDAHFMKEWNAGNWEGGHPLRSVSFAKVKKTSDEPEEILEFNCDVSLSKNRLNDFKCDFYGLVTVMLLFEKCRLQHLLVYVAFASNFNLNFFKLFYLIQLVIVHHLFMTAV